MVATSSRDLVRLAGELPRKVYRRLPSSSQKVLKKLVGGATLAATPVLSIIIPVYNVEGYVAETLDSLQRQSLIRWEAIVVNDGSTDGSAAVVDRYAKGDRRIHVIHQDNAGLGAARNVGIKEARGTYLTFLDSDDIIPDDAYKTMVETLNRTKSDFAVGAVHRVKSGKKSIPAWTNAVHSKSRHAITIDEFPDAIMDVLACNRVFRTSFWRSDIGDFPEGIAYEDHKVMVAAYVRAKKFDLLADVTYLWRIREDEGSISQQKHDLQNLLDRIGVKDDAFKVVSTEASALVRDSWLARVLDQDIPLYGEHALRADEQYQNAVRSFAARYVELADAGIWSGVRWNQRIKTSLMAKGDWHNLAKFNLDSKNMGGLPGSTIVGSKVELDFTNFPELENWLSEDARLLSARLTPLRAYIERARWNSGSWRLSGFAFASYVPADKNPWTRRFYLLNMRTEKTIELPDSNSESNYFATRFARHGNFDYSSTGFSLDISDELLESVANSAGTLAKDRWQLRVELATGEFRRDEAIEFSQKSGSAGWLRAGVISQSRIKVFPVMDAEDGLVIELRQEPIWLEELRLNDGGIEGSLSVSDSYRKSPEAVVLTRGAKVVAETPLIADADSERYEFGFANLSSTLRGGNTRLRIRNSDGSNRIVCWPEELSSPIVGSNGTTMRSTHGYVDFFPGQCIPFATEFSITNSIVAVSVAAPGLTLAELHESALSNAKHSIAVSKVEILDSVHAMLHFDLLAAREHTVGPNGTYRLMLGGRAARPSEALGDLLPVSIVDSQYRYDLKHAGVNLRRELLLFIGSPLNEREIGTYSQLNLRRNYRVVESPIINGVLFQCYRGETASDNQLAVHQELVKQGTNLALYWGVANSNVDVPSGGIPVIIGSKKWYEVLSGVTHLCNNIDFDRFFVKRAHQRFLQTFHGHPFKAMGIGFWEDKGFNTWEVESEVSRRNTAWDSIVLPNEESVRYYEEQYGFEGEYLVTGYPRNDAIVNGTSAEAKAKLADVYEIGLEKKLLLYAPTWRETSATGAWSATMFSELDIDMLAEALGDEYVLLIRGHNYNLREQSRVKRSASVVDVTDYPEINDLILAADVSLLDYSSLRFDWAITKKPMLFFVPDKNEYLAVRPGLFPYDESAPGPQLSSTAEVIIAIAQIDQYSETYGMELEIFNSRFNSLSDGSATKRVVEKFFAEEK